MVKRKYLLEKKASYLFLSLIILLYFFTRIIFLDADIPIWNSSYYSPIDEFYYTTKAFQLFNGIDERLTQAESLDHLIILSIVQQFLTYVSLEIFGNNYYGLRMPSLLMGIIVMWFMYVIFKKRYGILLAVLGSIILLSNYGFILANRIAEPTIFRTAFMVFFMYLLIAMSELKTKNLIVDFFLGFMGGFSVFYIYSYNVFIIPAALVVYSYISASIYGKIFNKGYGYFILGILVSLVIYVITAWYLFNPELDFVKTMHQGRVIPKPENFSLLVAIKSTYYQVLKDASYFKSHFFKMIYTISLWYFIINFCYFLIKYRNVKSNLWVNEIDGSVRKKHMIIDFIFIVFLLSFFAQTLFINDYPQRKLIILLPIVIYIILYFFNFIAWILPAKLKMEKTSYVLLFIAGSGLGYMAWNNIDESYSNIYQLPMFSYKKDMQILKKYNGALIVGGYSFGFRLYNNFHTAINKYAYWYTKKNQYFSLLNGLADKHPDLMVIDYKNAEITAYMEKIGLYPQKIIHHSIDPKYPNMVLYARHAAI